MAKVRKKIKIQNSEFKIQGFIHVELSHCGSRKGEYDYRISRLQDYGIMIEGLE